jgi:hypothetical protein
MVPVPDNTLLVTAALFQRSHDTQEDSRRLHLGASEVGEECLRKVWYSFRWAQRIKREGRMVRLLRRGDQEEKQLLDDLHDLGYEFALPIRASFVNGHFGGTPDGIVRGIPEAPATWHILELKTSNDSRWTELAKKGVELACPEHYAQMQVYMVGAKLDRALYLAVNKDDDRIYEERVPLNRLAAQRFIDRAERGIRRQTLPERISNKQDWYQCRPCKWNKICFEEMFPDRHCRTCLHVTPEVGGPQAVGTPDVGKTLVPGGWWCSVHKRHLTEGEQKAGCSHHLFLPSLLHWFEQVDATESTVVYRAKDGITTWTDDGPS